MRLIEEVPDADWDRLFVVNIGAAFTLSRAVAAVMKQAGGGRIINISSRAGLGPSLTGIQADCSAKHAVIGLTRQLARELGPFGITVNSVAPGFVGSNTASERQWAGYAGKAPRQGRACSGTDTRNDADGLCHDDPLCLSDLRRELDSEPPIPRRSTAITRMQTARSRTAQSSHRRR